MTEQSEIRKKNAAALKRLRQERKEAVASVRAGFKEQSDVRKKISQALKGDPKTVSEVAAAAGLPAPQVLWHITAMKKYDLVAEVGMSAEYYTYQLIEEPKP